MAEEATLKQETEKKPQKKYKNRYGSDFRMWKEKNRSRSTSRNICDTHIDGA